jgi:hypothetical protein
LPAVLTLLKSTGLDHARVDKPAQRLPRGGGARRAERAGTHHGDARVARGTPDQDRPVDEHRSLLLDAVRRHFKDVAMLFETAEEARPWIEAGVRIVAIAYDVAILQNGYRGIVAGLRGGADGNRVGGAERATGVVGFDHARCRAR